MTCHQDHDQKSGWFFPLTFSSLTQHQKLVGRCFQQQDAATYYYYCIDAQLMQFFWIWPARTTAVRYTKVTITMYAALVSAKRRYRGCAYFRQGEFNTCAVAERSDGTNSRAQIITALIVNIYCCCNTRNCNSDLTLHCHLSSLWERVHGFTFQNGSNASSVCCVRFFLGLDTLLANEPRL